MSCMDSKAINHVLLVVGILITVCTCSYFPSFKSYADSFTYMGESSPTAVKISANSNYVMVGFASGSLKIFYSTGSVYTYCNGHSSPIIDIEQIPYNGWITLDSTGKAIRWDTICYNQYTWTFPTTYPTDMSLANNNYGNYWIAFNLGNSILQYNAMTYSNTTTMVYNSLGSAYFKKIQYGPGHSLLYTAMNTTYVYQYSCATGNYSSTNLYTYYPGMDMTIVPGGNNEIVLLNMNYIMKFKNTSNYDLASYSENANLIAVSYHDGEIIYILANSNASGNLYIHSSTGSLKQTISYDIFNIKVIDASINNIVAVDSYGYLSVYSYDYTKSYNTDFPAWAISLIVSVFFFLCVAGIIMMIVRKRKLRQAQMVNNYNRFNNEPIQPFIAPSGQQTSGNIINPQPAWNAVNPPPQPYFNTYNPQNQGTAQQNPYQTNQPSYWS